MHLRPPLKPVSCITITNKAHEYGLLDKTGIKMTQSSENKWMFEAKRLDNGMAVRGLPFDNGVYTVIACLVNNEHGCSPYVTKSYEVDPSTIKPLFKTEPDRDVWIFENDDKRTLSGLNEHEASSITLGWVQTGSERFGTTQIFNGSGWVDLLHSEELRSNYVCRVKAPKYTIDTLMQDIENRIGSSDAEEIEAFINKFAKANGLGES